MLQQRRPVGLAAVWLALLLALMLAAGCSAAELGLTAEPPAEGPLADPPCGPLVPAGTRCRTAPSYTPKPTPVPTVDPCARLAGRPADCAPLVDRTPQNPNCSFRDYNTGFLYPLDLDRATECWIGETYPEWALRHLEGCQQCYRTTYYQKHGRPPPTFEFYKDGKVYAHGKDYLKSLRNVLALLDGYIALVDECEVEKKRARGKRRRLNPYMDMDRYNCAHMLRAGQLD